MSKNKSKFTISRLINWKVISLSQLPPSKGQLLFSLPLSVQILYIFIYRINIFNNYKDPGSIGLFDGSIEKKLFHYSMINKNEWLTVGLITSPHGINGKVKVKSLTDFEERFLVPGTRWVQKENDPPSAIELTSGFKQPGKETFIISFKGITTRNDAEKLKKHRIMVKLICSQIK